MALNVLETMNSILQGCSGSLCVAIDDHRGGGAAAFSKSARNPEKAAAGNDPALVLVVVDSCREIAAGNAVKWAARNVVQSGDCLTLIALFRSQRKKLPKLAGECCTSSLHTGEHPGEQRMRDWCTGLIQGQCDTSKLHLRVKAIPRESRSRGIIAAEANKLRASWIILDRSLKKEAKSCVESCSSNVVLVSQTGFRILCLNLKNPRAPASTGTVPSSSLGLPSKDANEELSSPEHDTPFTVTERGSSSSSSGVSEQDHAVVNSSSTVSKADSISIKRSCLDERLISQTKSILLDAEVFVRNRKQEGAHVRDVSESLSGLHIIEGCGKRRNRPPQRLFENLLPIQESKSQADVDDPGDRTSGAWKTVSLPFKRSLAGSPPLCSICQHASPVFGRPPRRFSYSELEFATGGFCKANFLAEGGYGSVYRGVLGDGIPIAVKQYKLASSQGDLEFCSEVEVLSCAQHRNVVMLIGYCIEKKRRLLVYEFICNGSLDSHLYGGKQTALKWSSRHKIAVGAARGLRYLHEECRVGCIVHRDMRPNNILLTHDFEPMVGDFGLARWQPDGDLGVETRVIGTFGYLAPEYAQTGQITEKADVYSFGVVLLELVTGRKAIDISRPRGQQCLTEWARPLLEEQAHQEMIDPALGNDFNQYEVQCMLYAASLCTQRDPHLRPRMSQVLRMLEGDLNISRTSSPMRSYSGRLTYSPRTGSSRSVSPLPGGKLLSLSDRFDLTNQMVNSYMSAHPIVGCDTKLSLEALKAAYRNKLDSGRNSFED